MADAPHWFVALLCQYHAPSGYMLARSCHFFLPLQQRFRLWMSTVPQFQICFSVSGAVCFCPSRSILRLLMPIFCGLFYCFLRPKPGSDASAVFLPSSRGERVPGVSLVSGAVDPVLLLDWLWACWCRLFLCSSYISLAIPSHLFPLCQHDHCYKPTASCFCPLGHCYC